MNLINIFFIKRHSGISPAQDFLLLIKRNVRPLKTSYGNISF